MPKTAGPATNTHTVNENVDRFLTAAAAARSLRPQKTSHAFLLSPFFLLAFECEGKKKEKTTGGKKVMLASRPQSNPSPLQVATISEKITCLEKKYAGPFPKCCCISQEENPSSKLILGLRTTFLDSAFLPSIHMWMDGSIDRSREREREREREKSPRHNGISMK